MTQQLESAFDQALRIITGSPAAMFILAAALIYLCFCLMGNFKKSIL